MKPLKIGDAVTHVINPTRKGIVTAVTLRPSGVNFGVTWDDLNEKSHFAMELKLFPSDQPIGFKK